MIQRIQSVYLFMTTLLSVLFLKGNIISFYASTGSVIKVTFSGLASEPAMQSSELIERFLPLSIFIILISAFALAIIFIYKKRNVQLTLVKVLLALISIFIIMLAFYSYSVIKKYDAEIIPGIKMAIPLIQLMFSFLAYRGIKKDDNLVKSYDRLR